MDPSKAETSPGLHHGSLLRAQKRQRRQGIPGGLRRRQRRGVRHGQQATRETHRGVGTLPGVLGSWKLGWANMEKYGEKKSEKSLKLSASCQVVWVHAKIAKCKGNKKYSIVYIVASCKNR